MTKIALTDRELLEHARSTGARAGGNLEQAQAEMRERNRRKKQAEKQRQERHGARWGQYGMVNADSSSSTHLSIRNWGLKIKLREKS